MKSIYEDSKVIGIRKYKAGYVVQEEMVKCGDNDEPLRMKVAYNYNGQYIGDSKTAYRLCTLRGIKPELKKDSLTVCTIGFCKREQKWYGWSHRAIWGYKVGDVIEEGSCASTSGWTDEYLKEHPEEDNSLSVGFEAKSLDDAKRMAVAFADGVS
jgi:hypothetical protein